MADSIAVIAGIRMLTVVFILSGSQALLPVGTLTMH